MTFEPTEEQRLAIDLFAAGDSLAIEAGAGTGKTSTLVLLGELAARANRRGQYLAFNKAIVQEAGAKMPANVRANTAHSLAFKAKGQHYAHRLRGGRLRSDEIARRLGIERAPFVVRFGTQTKVLQPGYLASLVMRTIKVFCQTADLSPDKRHVPYIDGIDLPTADGRRTYANNDEVRAHIAPAIARAWADMNDPNGQLPYDHGCYLKQWQLDGPRVHADFILFDECQPPSTLVALAGGGTKRLGDVEVGDRVVSYTKGRIMSERFGSVVLGRSVRMHVGELVEISACDERSSYTPNHICMARIGAAFEDKFILYLMRQGDRYRVGVTQGRHGTGPGRSTGLMGRLREERGDAAWVLAVFDNRREAEVAEQITSLTWRLPQVRFYEDRLGMMKFWDAWDMTFSDPDGCARAYGRDLRYPLIGTERRYMLGDRFAEIRACNLIDGMEVMHRDGTLHPITTWRSRYEGPVVSLTVSGPATYVADNIVTHNCQDANPVMLAIVAAQTHAQLVFVGDSQQQIYSFTGAVNALASVPAAHRTFLTRSFRFGDEIAEVANLVLDHLDADLRLVGLPSIPSTLASLEGNEDVLLCRTNAAAVEAVLNYQSVGRRPHLVGGGDDVVRFASAAAELQDGKRTFHPELACFESWGEVQSYVEDDPSGSELALLVKLVDDFGTDTIEQALGLMPPEHKADVIVSTAHKSKGREWDRVKLAGDFPDPNERDVSDEEWRLLYVSATRAKLVLDASACIALEELIHPEDPAPAMLDGVV